MKKILSLLALLTTLVAPFSALAINITVPAAGSAGQVLLSNANGTYSAVATSSLGISGSAGTGLNRNPFQATSFQGTSTSATTTIPNFESVLYADNFAGADMGAKINAAYAALPSIGGRIALPSGSYTYLTPIVINTNGKVVNLYCPSGGGASNNFIGGTTLTYSSSTGDAITINTNNYIAAGTGIDNCNIQGTNGTTARTTRGIVLGGTNGAFGVYLRGVNVSGFGTGVRYDSNTSFALIDSSVIHFNGRNIDEPDTTGANGENMRINNSVIADSNNQAGGVTDLYCVQFQESGNVQWTISNTSIDDCQLYVNQFGGTSNEINLVSDHFENPNGHTYDYINTISNIPNTVIKSNSTDYMNDVNGGMPEYIYNGATFISVADTADSNSGVSNPVTRFINNQNANNKVSVVGFTPKGQGVTYVYGTTLASSTINENGTSGVTTSNFESTLYADQFPGSDIGAKINAAYNSIASSTQTGVTIRIPGLKYSYSTPILCGNKGVSCLLEGSPVGTELDYTGTGTSTTIDTGIQSTGVQHVSGGGLLNIRFVGNNTSTSTAGFQTGVVIGSSNGTDGTVLNGLTIEGFGVGLSTGKNTYHFNMMNSTIRNNGQNAYIAPADNSGEGMNFNNVFMIDAANHNPTSCFYTADFSNAELVYTGGSIDDCGVYIGKQNNSTFTGVNWENPDPAYGQYPYILAGDSHYSVTNINGGQVFNDQASAPSTWFNVAGGDINFNGVTLFKQGGVITNLVTTAGGHVTWSGLNNTGGAVTNIVAGNGFSVNGTNNTYQISNLAGSPSFLAVDNLGNIIATSTPSISGANLSGVVTSVGPVTSFGSFTSSVLTAALTDESGTGAIVANTSPSIVTPIIVTNARIPLINGGAGTNSTLTLQPTSGVGASGADIIFKNGNNGATEAARLLNNGNFGIGTSSPAATFQVTASTTNATTTIIIGRAGQTQGSCVALYDQSGTAYWLRVVAGTLLLNTTSCQ